MSSPSWSPSPCREEEESDASAVCAMSSTEGGKTNHDVVGEHFGVFGPQVARGVFVVGGFGRWPYEFERLLGVGSDADSSADFAECWRCFVDLDVDVGVFEQGDGGAEAADASADDGDAERFVGSGWRRHGALEGGKDFWLGGSMEELMGV